MFPSLIFELYFAEQGCGFYGSIIAEDGGLEENIIEGSFYKENENEDDELILLPEVEEFLNTHGLNAGG